MSKEQSMSDRGPTPSQKRKIAVLSSPLASDATSIDSPAVRITEIQPLSRLIPNTAFVSPLPQRQNDVTQPTTPVVGEEGSTSSAYYSVLRHRVLRYTRIANAAERTLEAIRLIPALIKLFPLSVEIDVVREFAIPINVDASPDTFNAPFLESDVWRRAFEASFPVFVREFNAGTLPSFIAEGSSQSAETDIVDRARQWRQYYYLVYELFDNLRKNAVIATQRVPSGEWREFYDDQHDVSTSLLLDVPEEALIVTPEQLGVIGDVYDVAVSTFWPRPHATRTHDNILRWYSTFAPGEFDMPNNDQAYALLHARRHWSSRDHLREFVVEHKAQFVRARLVLQLNTPQWWSVDLPFDANMLERMTPESVDARKQALQRRIESTRGESRRFKNDLKTLPIENDDEAIVKQLEPSALFGDNPESLENDAMFDQQLIDFREQQTQERTREIEALVHQNLVEELASLRNILSEQTHATLEVVSYEIANVSMPVRGAPLQAENFAILSSPLQPESRSREKRARIDITSPRTILFSESEDDDDVVAAQVYRPKDLDRRLMLQSKYRVNLNCILRYLTGWTSGRNGALEFEFAPPYDCLFGSSLFSPAIAQFIFWLAFHRADATRNVETPLQLAQSLTEETEQAARERDESDHEFAIASQLVNSRTFPYLVNYIRGL